GRRLPVPDRLGFGDGMSDPAAPPSAPPALPATRWSFAAQAWRVMRGELRRSASWRTLWLVVVAALPLALITGHVLEDHQHQLEEHTIVLAAIIQIFYVRFGIFFACLGVFMRLLRGEVAERTLHYLFLAPVRREALLVGKFVGGAVTTVLVMTTAVLACFLLMFGHFDQ